MATGKICRVIFWFVVTARLVAFATDSNDMCRKEQILERLIELEYKVKEIDREIVKANVGFVGLLDAQNRRIEEIASQPDDQLVVFSAYNPVNKFPLTGHIIVFGSTQLNEGNAYSSSTGAFTAPVNGLYQFNAHICNRHGKYIVFTITRDGTETLALSTQYDDTPSCGSVNALAILNAGEEVFVKCSLCETAAEINEDEYRRNSFNGVLLQKK